MYADEHVILSDGSLLVVEMVQNQGINLILVPFFLITFSVSVSSQLILNSTRKINISHIYINERESKWHHVQMTAPNWIIFFISLLLKPDFHRLIFPKEENLSQFIKNMFLYVIFRQSEQS